MTVETDRRTDAAETAVLALRINEIFLSLQGETSRTGLPTAFIRLTGCPLRCSYCDTDYAFHLGEKMSLDQILSRVAEYRTRHVTVTGGEPLAQRGCHTLLTRLCDEGYAVSLETSGAMDIARIDQRVIKVMDIKTPGSGQSHLNRLENLDCLSPADELKFVICDRLDYEWSRKLLIERRLDEICDVLFSPEHTGQDAAQLAEWILEDRLPVRFQIQLHKYLWGNVPGR